MKKFLHLFSVIAIAVIMTCLVLPVSAQMNAGAAKVTTENLNNDSIVKMIGAGLSEMVVIAKIKSSNSSFDTSAAALQSLKKQGVSDTIVLAMVQKASGMDVSMPTTAAMANTSSNANGIVIPDGTEIKVASVEDISGQKVVEGDSLTFKVTEDVKINGITVIAKDSAVKGTVSSAKKKGMMGRSGELSIRIESVNSVDGQKVKLRASKSGEGGNNTGSTVALTVLFGPIGLLRHGKEAKIKAGTVLSAFTDQVITIGAAK